MVSPLCDEGYVHSVETAGTVDGPGMRFVVFLTGCPLRCLYCHNPDTRRMKDGKLTRATDLVQEIAQYADFFKRTGGGVTISGGEPLLQQDFVTAIFKACKEMGLHTALDTSGFSPKPVKEELLAVTDLVLLDIKSFSPETYQRVTSQELAPTLAFARRLAAMGKPMWVRCVIVPDLTDNLDDLAALADFLKGLGNVEKVEVLPFHKMGEAKWKELGLAYELAETQPPTAQAMQRIRAIFADKGLVAV